MGGFSATIFHSGREIKFECWEDKIRAFWAESSCYSLCSCLTFLPDFTSLKWKFQNWFIYKQGDTMKWKEVSLSLSNNLPWAFQSRSCPYKTLISINSLLWMKVKKILFFKIPSTHALVPKKELKEAAELFHDLLSPFRVMTQDIKLISKFIKKNYHISVTTAPVRSQSKQKNPI